jgi:hypothetical protein
MCFPSTEEEAEENSEEEEENSEEEDQVDEDDKEIENVYVSKVCSFSTSFYPRGLIKSYPCLSSLWSYSWKISTIHMRSL